MSPGSSRANDNILDPGRLEPPPPSAGPIQRGLSSARARPFTDGVNGGGALGVPRRGTGPNFMAIPDGAAGVISPMIATRDFRTATPPPISSPIGEWIRPMFVVGEAAFGLQAFRPGRAWVCAKPSAPI